MRNHQEEPGRLASLERLIDCRAWADVAESLEAGDTIPGFIITTEQAGFVEARLPDGLELIPDGEYNVATDMACDWNVMLTEEAALAMLENMTTEA